MAKALGEETLGVDERKIPSTASVRRVEEKVEELGLIFEEREEAMFAIKEEVVHLLDVLDLDLNATSVEEMFIVNQEQFESLQPQDMESARQTLGNLRRKVEAKKQEVSHYQARAPRRQPNFFTETAVTPERKVEKSFPRWEINRHAEG